MADPLSIAALTIAVFDDLIQLSKWTAEVVKDVRAFDSDTQRLNNLLSSDTSRSQLLKNLLFSEASVYGGRTLFDQFDDRDQQETLRQLEEVKNILQEGRDLLQRRYGISDASDPTTASPSCPPTNSLSPISPLASASGTSPTSTRSKSPVSFKTKVLWSIRDKERVQEIIDKFVEQHQRVEDSVKLWCLASQLGVNPDHLRRLRNDTSSKQLGFDVDANLRLTQQYAEETVSSLELTDSKWSEAIKNAAQINEAQCFRVFKLDERLFLQENHRYDSPEWWNKHQDFKKSSLDPVTSKRVESLTKLLYQPKERVFRIPKCLGWNYMSETRIVSFVFDAPAQPTSLLRLLTTQKGGPELGQRYRLATGLATCIAQLHMVGWLHESFRSEHILFFPQTLDDGSTDLDYANPQVLGFEFSRLDINRTRGFVDFDPNLDLYRHPERQGPEPEVTFSRIHDIYALGVVLLEIGLWEPVITLKKDNFKDARISDAYLVQGQLLNHAEHRLEKKVGKKYKQIVVKCLKGDFGVTDDNKQDLKLQQAFRTQVLDILQKAADNV